MMNISKIVIPAAGYGTRFLPYTKAVPKEMLPLLNKPAFEYIIQEGKECGVNQFAIIRSHDKNAIEHYFSPDERLEHFLQKKGKTHITQDLNALINSTRFEYIYQEEALGLGHAISLAKNCIDTDFFGVMLPDDIMLGSPCALAQLMQIAKEKNASVIAVQEVPYEQTASYGVISIKNHLHDSLFEVADMVEKPQPKDAPSNLTIIGRYILSSALFPILEKLKPTSGGEIQLTDGLAALIKSGHPIYAVKVNTRRFDIGTPAGWLQANNYLFDAQAK